MHKKVLMLATAALVALSAAGCADLEEAASGDSAGGGIKSDKRGGGHKVGNVGDTVRNAGTSYKVAKVRTTKTLGDPEFLGERANGTFVIVNLAITNHKNKTKTFTNSTAKLTTADGREYETSTDAEMSLDKSLMLEDIQPDLTTRGQLAFDVPESKLNGAKLVIEDFWGNGKVRIKLGL
jgi:hypothetical protein